MLTNVFTKTLRDRWLGMDASPSSGLMLLSPVRDGGLPPD